MKIDKNHINQPQCFVTNNGNRSSFLVKGTELNITQLGDVTTLILEDIVSVECALQDLNVFWKSSGLKLYKV